MPNKKQKFFEILFLFLLSLTPLLWFGNNYVILGHDSGFRIDIHHHMRMLWNTFNPSINTGVDWSIYKGFLIIQLPEFILQTILGSLESAQKYIFIFWFFGMALCMYLAMMYFFPKRDQWFIRMYASVFWVFNFFILQAWFIAERAKFSLYAALPLSIALFFAVFEKKISVLLGSFLFGILYFFCNGGSSPPLFGASIIVWATAWVYLSFLKRKFFFSLKIAIGFFLCFLFFNAYWIFPHIQLLKTSYESAVSSEGGIDGLLAWEREISKHASIINLLRLQGFPDWYDNPNHPYSGIFLKHPLFILLSFFPVFVICFGLIIFRKHLRILNKNLIILCFILLFIGLFFTSGSHPPTGDIYVLLMKKIPGFAIFRSSFFKFAPVLWFSVIVLSGYFLQIFFQNGRRFIFLQLIIIAGILIYHFPFFSSDFFNFSKDFTTRLQIPSYVYKTQEYLMKDASIGRILIVPELDRGFINKPIDTYLWGYYSLDALPRIISDKSFLANDSPHEIIDSLYSALYEGEKEKFFGLAKALGVTHVLYRNDVKFSNTAKKISQEKIQQIAEEVAFQEGEWSVYSLGINAINSYKTDTIFSLVSVTHPSFFVSSYSGVIQTDWNTAKNIGSSIIGLQGECFYCKEGEYESFVSSIQIPTSRYKKKVSTDIDALLSSSLFSLREYIKTKSDEILKEYASIVETIDRQVSLLDGRAKDYYNARVLGFLLKQQELGDEKIDQILSPIIESYMENLWKSDATMYRFGITIPEDMTYMIQSTDGFFSEKKFFTKGYYRFEIPKKSQKDIPKLFFVTEQQQSNPSKKLFVFPYSYDQRWTFDGIHVIANGYANGWIIDGRDTSQVVPVYTPHRIFLVGVVISAGSLLGFTVFFLKKYFLK